MLSACSDSSRLQLKTESFSWAPKLKVDFQEQPILVGNDLVYQEV